MLSSNPSDEVKKFKEQEKFKKELDDRMDWEWKLYRGDPSVYDIPVEEGEWEPIITNRAMVEVNRVVEDLANAARKLWIPMADEDQRDRKMISATEQTALGIIHLADLLLQDSPMGSDLQTLLAQYWVQRGWSTKRFVLRDEDNKLVPDLAVWDTRNVQWREGKKRLTWVGYKRWISKTQADDLYKGHNGQAGTVSKLIEVYDIWDCSVEGKPAQEGVIIGSEYVKDPEDVKVGSYKLDYIPIHIASRRGMPLIQDENDDNIKFTGQSYLTNNSKLYEIESRLLSYFLTSASKDAKAPIIIEWDGKGQSPTQKFKGQDPNVAGRVITLDTSHGERLAQQLPPSNAGSMLQMMDMLQGLLGIGGMNPVSFGRINQALPAQGIDILSHAAKANERAFQNGMEGDYEWLAGESVRQFRLGKFKEQEFEGYDKSNNSFLASIKPKDINENWRFKCELIPDLIRDKASMIQIARTATDGDNPLMSVATAQDEFGIVLDPDSENAKIAIQQSKQALGTVVTEGLVALVEDLASSKGKNKSKAAFVLSLAMENLKKMMGIGQQPPEQPQGTPAAGVVDNNQMVAGSVPPEVREAARKQGGGVQ